MRLKRQVLAVALVLLILLPVASAPRTANAFPGEAMAAAVWTFVKNRWNEISKLARKTGADLAFKNALKVYLTKVAEDTAIWLASAGTGQKPLFVTDPHYFTNLGDAAAGEFLDTLATSSFGIDVCKPTDLRMQFSVESAVRSLVDPANWCQNKENAVRQASLTTDTFLVGEPEEQLGLMQSVRLTMPQAEANRAAIQAIAERCQQNRVCQTDHRTSCTTDSDCPPLPAPAGTCAPFDLYTSMEQARDFGGDCSPDLILATYCPVQPGAEDTFSLGACLDAYTRDITDVQAEIEQVYRLNMNLCSAKKRVARCTASTIFNNAAATGQQISNNEFIPQFSQYLEPGENDLGQIMTLAEKALNASQEAFLKDQAQRLGIGPVVDPVTGEVKTPAEQTKAAAEKLADDPSGSAFGIYTGSPVADAIGVFTNTLTKKLLERIFQKGFNPGTNPGSARFAGGQLVSGSGGVAAARELFASIARPEISAGGPYDILSELTACPPSNPAPNNCAITEKFRSAIEQKLTVRQAIDRGLLEGDQRFGFDANGIEPDFNQGLPYRSMLVLRTHRVIPVGWELAAQYIRDVPGGRGNFTLNDVVGGFELCSGDTPSPFCGLVDPDWVLKAPEAFCAREGFGETILSQQWVDHDASATTTKVASLGRQEVCVDEQTCIQENADGSCKAFGSCLEERPIWRLAGQTCDEQFASCETFTTPTGSEASYLENTVDAATCNAENAGCRWYCNERDEGGEFSCTEDAGEKKYFTGAVSSCPTDAAGCTEFLATTNGTNLLANSSFETRPEGAGVDDGVADTFPGWTASGVTLEAVSTARSGGAGARVTGGGGSLEASFDMRRSPAGESFTASMFAQSATSCGGTFGIRSSSGGTPYLSSEVITLATGWQRYVTTLAFASDRAYDTTAVTAFFTPADGCAAIVDDVQLELGAAYSSYKDYGTVNATHLKVGSNIAAPLVNDGFESFVGTADDEEVDTFDGWTKNHGSARETLEATATSAAGSTALRLTVTPGEQFDGVVSDLTPVTPGTERIYTQSVWIYVPTDVTLTGTWILDRHALIGDTCTGGSCHHYTVLGADSSWTNDSIPHGEWVRKWFRFKTEADVSNLRAFVSIGSDDGSGGGTVLVDRYAFEAESGDISCTADEVGCDLYTSASDTIPGVATDADVCSADDVGCRAFLEMPLTDNGADPTFKERTGYRCSEDQTVSCASDADCTGIGACLPSVSLTPSSGQRCSVANVGCEEYTNLDEVARGGEGKEYYTQIRACAQPPDSEKTFYTWIGNESTGFQLVAYNLSQAADGSPAYVPGTDASLCDESIFSDPGDTRWSPDCRQFYAPSATGIDTYYRLYSKTITVSEDCHPLRNTLDGQTYLAIPSEGVTCPASAVQCREYRGPSGFNTRTVVNDDFNDGDTLGWDGGTWSTRSLTVGGGSMAVGGGSVTTNSDFDVPAQLSEGKTYILSFWAGATTSASSEITARFDGGGAAFAGSATARFDGGTGEPEWNFYRLGPVTLDRAPDTSIDDGDGIDNLRLDGTNAFVIDNFELTETTENVYEIKNSYRICTGSENCDRYSKSDGTTHTLKSFTRLCSAEKVGCQALIKTQNSDSPFSESFDGGDGTVTVPGDELAFVVNRPEFSCRSEYQGCTELGSPVLTRDGVEQYNAVALIDDPDTYATTLCGSGEAGCDAFTNKRTGEQTYFRNPEPYTCEYKTVSIDGVQTSGWFKTGTSGLNEDDRCSVTYPPPDGQPEGAPSSGQGWVGLCPSAQAGCTEYLDAVEPSTNTIVVDGGFELDVPFSDDGWNRSYCTAGDLSCSQRTTEDVTDIVHGGARALHLSSGDAGAHGGIYENIDLEHFTPGAEYDLSGWIRTQSDGALRVSPGYVEFHHRVGESFAFIPDTAASLAWYTVPSGLTEWTRFQLHFTVPKDTDANSVRIWPVQMENAGEIWLDDVIVAQSLASYALEQNVDTTSCGVVDEDAGCHAFNIPENGTTTLDVDARVGNSLTCPSTDGTCDANAVVKVQRDRECSRWLSCQSSMIITDPQTGKQDDVCLGVGTCTRLGDNGQCAQFEPQPDKVCSDDASISCTSDADCSGNGYCRPASTLTLDTPSGVDQIQNLTGISKVGARWADGTIEGYYPVDAMPEIGLSGASSSDLVKNGGFEDGMYAIDCSGSQEPADWDPRDATIDVEEDSDRGCIDQLDENNVMKVTPTAAWGGARTSIGQGSSLPTGAQYTVSFRIKYVQTPMPTDRVWVEFGYDDVGLVTFSQIAPTAGWQSFILGPVTMPTHTTTRDIFLNFIRTDTSTNTAFEIDDVSLKPVLEVQGEPTRIVRSCRAYPTEDATSCTYTDENGTLHQGWNGYCLERDPNDPRQCLSWYPVDLIAGEASIFGSFRSASYEGRRPLFYCAETEGRYSSTDYIGSCANKAQYAGAPPTPNDWQLRWPIQTQWSEFRSDDDDYADCSANGFLTCGCNDAATSAIPRRTGTNSCAGFAFCGATGPKDETFGGVACSGRSCTIPAVTADQYYEYEVERIVWTVQKTTHDEEWGAGRSFEASPVNDWLIQCDDATGCNRGNTFSIQTRFNATTRAIESFTFSANDGSAGAGGVWISGFVYLREMCRAIVQVADMSRATPWQSRVSDDSTYVDPELGYRIGADFAPIGAIAAPTQPEDGCGAESIDPALPQTWDSDCRNGYEGRQPLEVLNAHVTETDEPPARSGSPFSCKDGDGSCVAGSMCRGGDQDGKPCNTITEINNCYNAATPGVCVGLTSTIGRDRVDQGLPMLKRLWAKSLAGWHWLFEGTGYTAVPDYTWNTPNTRCTGTPPTRPAYVRGSNDDLCAIPPTVTNVSIGAFPNGQTSGDVHVGAGGTLTMYFNSTVDLEQLPLQHLRVDWGDGITQDVSWGYAPKDDPNQPHLFTHGYSRRGTFRPKVQLLDNWGWCTNGTSRDDCDGGSWVTYNGNVIVE